MASGAGGMAGGRAGEAVKMQSFACQEVDLVSGVLVEPVPIMCVMPYSDETWEQVTALRLGSAVQFVTEVVSYNGLASFMDRVGFRGLLQKTEADIVPTGESTKIILHGALSDFRLCQMRVNIGA